MPKPSVVEILRDYLLSEIAKEENGLRDISGPTGMRNSLASSMGLARNSTRREILEMLNHLVKVQSPSQRVDKELAQ